jgi:hypothetical protein
MNMNMNVNPYLTLQNKAPPNMAVTNSTTQNREYEFVKCEYEPYQTMHHLTGQRQTMPGI